MPADASCPDRSWPLVALIVAGVAAVVGLLSSAQSYFMMVLEGRPAPLDRLAAWTFLPWLYWAALTPAVLLAGRRIPFERVGWRRAALLHLPIAATLVAVQALATVGLGTWFAPPAPGETFRTIFPQYLTGRTIFSLFTYAAILAIGSAVDYYRKYRERELHASRLEARLARAQIQALEMQIRPHFLFNTLHTIAGLVREGDNDAAVRMLAGLSDLLRYALETSGRHFVPLEEELAFARRYLEIQRIRFQDRLTVREDVDGATLDAWVPTLILQPLVENAVQHGVAPRSTAGRIELVARRAGARLRIEVRDNGGGPPAGGNRAGGMGLPHTRARLEQIYGGAAQLALRHAPGQGTVASLDLPFQHGADMGAASA